MLIHFHIALSNLLGGVVCDRKHFEFLCYLLFEGQRAPDFDQIRPFQEEIENEKKKKEKKLRNMFTCCLSTYISQCRNEKSSDHKRSNGHMLVTPYENSLENTSWALLHLIKDGELFMQPPKSFHSWMQGNANISKKPTMTKNQSSSFRKISGYLFEFL